MTDKYTSWFNLRGRNVSYLPPKSNSGRKNGSQAVSYFALKFNSDRESLGYQILRPPTIYFGALSTTIYGQLYSLPRKMDLFLEFGRSFGQTFDYK